MANKLVVDYWLVFRDLPAESKTSRLWRLLKRGFEHVELWRCDRGVWIRVDPCLETVLTEAYVYPPWELVLPELNPTFVHVQRLVENKRVREPFFFGPWTCVEITKAFIGLRAPFVRTPYQLYKAVTRK